MLGFPGIPGSNGIPGVPGVPGVPGPHGPQGREGAKGQIGDKGSQGMPGPRGDRGREGPPGKSGPRGIKGMKGQQGLAGIVGMKGERGIVGNPGSKGEKGESIKASQASVVPQTNWKQCVWKSHIGTSNGKIKVITIRIITLSKENSFLFKLKKNLSPFTHRLSTHYINKLHFHLLCIFLNKKMDNYHIERDKMIPGPVGKDNKNLCFQTEFLKIRK